MAIAFQPGQVLTREDLNIFLTNSQAFPSNAAEISYAIYWVDPGPPEVEVLIGSATRTPVNPAVGEYYASLMVPSSASAGDYRIRWTIKELVNSPAQQVVQEFAVVATGSVTTTAIYSASEQALINSLRLLIRDQNPDRHYHFRPPEHEGTIGQYNRVFGQIWEDAELYEYLQRALAWWNMFPPSTNVCSLDMLYIQYGAWTTAIIWGAIVHAALALAFNWVADEFSVVPGTCVSVVLPDGRELVVPIEDLYSICEVVLGLDSAAAGGPQPSPGQSREEIREAFHAGQLRVKAVDSDSGDVGVHQVTRIFRHQTPHKRIFKITLVDGSSVSCTEDHSVFHRKGPGVVPVAAQDIRAGDTLAVVRDGVLGGAEVSAVEELPAQEITYDLSVPGPQNFVLANGILAHNSYSIGGVSLDLDRSSKYESLKSNAEGQFDKAVEAKRATTRYIRGLQQPKYGIGIRSAMGPAVGRGVLSPRNFL